MNFNWLSKIARLSLSCFRSYLLAVCFEIFVGFKYGLLSQVTMSWDIRIRFCEFFLVVFDVLIRAVAPLKPFLKILCLVIVKQQSLARQMKLNLEFRNLSQRPADGASSLQLFFLDSFSRIYKNLFLDFLTEHLLAERRSMTGGSIKTNLKNFLLVLL